MTDPEVVPLSPEEAIDGLIAAIEARREYLQWMTHAEMWRVIHEYRAALLSHPRPPEEPFADSLVERDSYLAGWRDASARLRPPETPGWDEAVEGQVRWVRHEYPQAVARIEGLAARPETPGPYCPCAGTCHHSPNPCSLSCLAARPPETTGPRTYTQAEHDESERQLRDCFEVVAKLDAALAARPPEPSDLDVEGLVAAMNAAYTYRDADNAVPVLPFIDDIENFWEPFARIVAREYPGGVPISSPHRDPHDGWTPEPEVEEQPRPPEPSDLDVERIETLIGDHNMLSDGRCDCGDHDEWPMVKTFNRHVAEFVVAGYRAVSP